MTDNTLRPNVLLDHQEIRRDLTDRLVSELYGSDLDYIGDGELVGLTATTKMSTHDRDLYLQRGLQYPPARGQRLHN